MSACEACWHCRGVWTSYGDSMLPWQAVGQIFCSDSQKPPSPFSRDNDFDQHADHTKNMALDICCTVISFYGIPHLQSVGVADWSCKRGVVQLVPDASSWGQKLLRKIGTVCSCQVAFTLGCPHASVWSLGGWCHPPFQPPPRCLGLQAWNVNRGVSSGGVPSFDAHGLCCDLWFWVASRTYFNSNM